MAKLYCSPKLYMVVTILIPFDLICCGRIGNRRGEDNAVNAEFQYKYDNEEVRLVRLITVT